MFGFMQTNRKVSAKLLRKQPLQSELIKIDKAKFDEGLRLFRAENYSASRDFLNQADVEKKDSKTQFYIAYCFYRQGFGKIYSDNSLFQQGLESLSLVDGNFKSDDQNLTLKTPAELKNELQQGLQFTTDDLNPLKVLRERK